MSCDKCFSWYHIECIGMTAKQYKYMIKDSESSSPMFHWYCRTCKDRCLEAISKIDMLENQTSNLASRVTTLDERVEALESKISQKVKKTIMTEMDERTDIERRKLNLIVFGMPEPICKPKDGSKPGYWYTKENKMADMDFFEKMTSSSMDTEVQRDSVRDVLRLGAKRNDGKPRPLKISFTDIGVKREVLGKAKLLKSGKHNMIFISPDLTPQQREKDRVLRQELKSRRDEGEEHLVIRRGRITNKKVDVDKECEDSDGKEIEEDMPALAPPAQTSESESEQESDEDIEFSEISKDDIGKYIDSDDSHPSKEPQKSKEQNTVVEEEINLLTNQNNTETADNIEENDVESTANINDAESTTIILEDNVEKEGNTSKPGLLNTTVTRSQTKAANDK